MPIDNLDPYAKAAYNAYCDSREWKSVRGEPLPAWDKVDQVLKVSWRIAARATLEKFATDVTADLMAMVFPHE